MSNNNIEDYGWESADETCAMVYIAPKILNILKSLKAKRVLDIGSGNGKLCSVLFDEGYQAVGIDPDKKGIEISQSSYPHIHFYKIGIQDDPKILLNKEKPFDAVVATEVIEHLFSPHLLPVFSNVLLRESGYIIISTPYHGYVKNLSLSLINKWDSHHDPMWHGGHIKFWSRKTLSKLLQDNGFRVVKFTGAGRIPYLWKSMVIVARKRNV